jgi:hypothetical protein
MKVVVNKCRFTGQLFEDDAKYKKHLAKIRREMKRERQYEKVRTDFFDWLAAEKQKIVSLDMIAPWFLENQRYLMDASNAGVRPKHSNWFEPDKFYDDDVYTKFTLDGNFEQSLSNTHSCPDDGVTNWGGMDKNAPRGYIGWRCRTGGTLQRNAKHMAEYPYKMSLDLVGIKTGTGGGGNENWSYDASIFLADWPGLNDVVIAMERDRIIAKLKGVR